MSYSYIKTVFPDFKFNPKFASMYNSLNSIKYNNESESLPFNPIVQENDYSYADNTVSYPVLINNSTDATSSSQLEDKSKSLPVTFNKELKEQFHNELHPVLSPINYATPHPNGNEWYMEPIRPENFTLENFRNENSCKSNYNHVVHCQKCKELFKLYIQDKTDEIWDIISYILFAIFVLLLLKMF